MAFSLGTSDQNAFATTGGPSFVKAGSDLEDILTEGLGFLALGGEAKVQLLPSAWPPERLPPPTASLMSVASQKGLVAAAGPSAVIIATTESVRKAFEAPRSGDSEIRPFQPQLILPMHTRVSQVAFTADETYLILSAENGGVLAVYEVHSLLSGSTELAFTMTTNSSSLRALVPNPTSEKGELIALVTTDGKLMMANLKERAFVLGINGQVLKDGVSCVSWSTRGKQLVAGLGNGCACQMTPDGVSKGDIPRAPNVDQSHYESKFYIVTRQPPSEFTFQKIADPAEPFGLRRYPPHQFLLRLKDFPPNIQDLIIVASSASVDIGLFSRSKSPLVTDKTLDKVVGVFTMTTPSDDSRRAQLPLAADLGDTSPIGVALDLSSKERVIKPISGDEIDQSPNPLPAFLVLNNEGILASWWVIYSESIKHGTMYSGMVAASEAHSTTASAITPLGRPFGTSSSNMVFSSPALGTSANSTLGFPTLKPTTSPAFGTTSQLGPTVTGGTFGSTSGLGQKPSPWGTGTSSTAANTGAVFGSSAFGSSTAPTVQGIAFGGPASLGTRPSPWSQVGSLGNSSGSAFGTAPSAGNSLFGSSSSAISPSSGGFAGFAKQNGFAAAAANNGGESIFATKSASISLASSSDTKNNSIFGGNALKVDDKTSDFSSGGGFTLGSTFKPDGSAKDHVPNTMDGSGSSFFGSGFGATLGEVQKNTVSANQNVDTDMDADEPLISQENGDSEILGIKKLEFSPVTTISTPAGPKFHFPTTTNSSMKTENPPRSTSPQSTKTKVDIPISKPIASNVGGEPDSPKPIIDPPALVKSYSLVASQSPEATKFKQEPQPYDDSKTNFEDIPEAPLPPDPTSKTSYTIGESSVSSIEQDAPLPPDFMPTAASKKVENSQSPVSEGKNEKIAEPEPVSSHVMNDSLEDDGSNFGSEDDGDASESGSQEGSGEDVANDLSPSSGSHQTPGFTPQSSFSGAVRGTGSDFFTKISRPLLDINSRSLFGEIASHTAPILPPPKPLSSPRSPSPVRKSLPGRLLRPDASRSVSAPGFASQLLGPNNSSTELQASISRSSLSSTLEQRKAEELRKRDARERKEADESQALIDKEDESIQKFLQQEIVGTKVLDDFIAHQDYVGNTDKDSISSQVEAVYRDINSMIDTLGVNSCALKSFIKGHEEQSKISGRKSVDLEDAGEWCLVEMHYLSVIIEKDLGSRLSYGRIKDVSSKLEFCAELEKDRLKLRAKCDDTRMLLTSHSDSDYVATARSQPLSAEQAVQQHDLRRDFTNIQKLLGEAEENLTVLRAKLASQNIVRGNISPGPTVEAVMRTIMKMTNMAERRSGDIDVLENQMRKLRLNSVTSNGGSRESSPFATPTSKSSVRQPSGSIIHSHLHTPENMKETSRAFQASLASSSYLQSPKSPQRKINLFTNEDKERLKSNGIRRKEITAKLRMALQKSTVRVLAMDME